jgi:transposase
VGLRIIVDAENRQVFASKCFNLGVRRVLEKRQYFVNFRHISPSKCLKIDPRHLLLHQRSTELVGANTISNPQNATNPKLATQCQLHDYRTLQELRKIDHNREWGAETPRAEKVLWLDWDVRRGSIIIL